MFSHRAPYAAQSDSVRRPIRLRTPPDQIASAVRLDGVRCTMKNCRSKMCKSSISADFKGVKSSRLEGVNAALEFSNRKKYRRRTCAVH
jgi:hypothetical protein